MRNFVQRSPHKPVPIPQIFVKKVLKSLQFRVFGFISYLADARRLDVFINFVEFNRYLLSTIHGRFKWEV